MFCRILSSKECLLPLLPSLVLLLQKSSSTSEFCLVLPFRIFLGHFSSHYCSNVCFGARLSVLSLQRKTLSPACPQCVCVTPMYHWYISESMACPRGSGVAKAEVSLLNAGRGHLELPGECGDHGDGAVTCS